MIPLYTVQTHGLIHPKEKYSVKVIRRIFYCFVITPFLKKTKNVHVDVDTCYFQSFKSSQGTRNKSIAIVADG